VFTDTLNAGNPVVFPQLLNGLNVFNISFKIGLGAGLIYMVFKIVLEQPPGLLTPVTVYVVVALGRGL
jgi:hypothetical protein